MGTSAHQTQSTKPAPAGQGDSTGLLTRADVRAMATRLGFRPTKRRGQNFLVDPNTVRRLVRLAGVTDTDTVLEIGPGLGSLTLGLLGQARRVVAVEVDPVLAELLPRTVETRLGAVVGARLSVLCADALHLSAADLAAAASPSPAEPSLSGPSATGPSPTGPSPAEPSPAEGAAGAGLPGVLAANLPYNVAVPLLLELLAAVPSIQRGLVMVQAEVADRLTAPPGNRVYGAPTVKLAWYARARSAGRVPRPVFWPEPNVDSGLVAFERLAVPRPDDLRADVFAAVDAAFASRRKMLRGALAGWAGSPSRLEAIAAEAGVSPEARGETLDVEAFLRLAEARARHPR